MKLFILAVVAVLGVSSHAQTVTVHQAQVPILPGSTLPLPNAASKSDEIVKIFNRLGRTTKWDVVKKIPFEGEIGEPEGMTVIGEDRYFVSSNIYSAPTVSFGNGTIINGTDRSNGAGIAHMVVFDGKGKRVADAQLTSPGSNEYHGGGVDYDGTKIWGTIAQYRPNTTAYVVSINPRNLKMTTHFHVDDHLGGIVHDTKGKKLVTLNWGSRNSSTFTINSGTPNTVLKPDFVTKNPSYFIDYQDCKHLGYPRLYDGRAVMMCTGVASIGSAAIGGVAIVDEETLIPLAEVPIAVLSDLGSPITQNPMDVDVVKGRLRFYFLPDQQNTTLYVLEADPNSPFEF